MLIAGTRLTVEFTLDLLALRTTRHKDFTERARHSLYFDLYSLKEGKARLLYAKEPFRFGQF